MATIRKQKMKTSMHQLLKMKAKNRVDDLQGMFSHMQQATVENRGSDVALLEEQVSQMLEEWKDELHHASYASKLQAGSPSSSELSYDMEKLLQLKEEDDDASSTLAACVKIHQAELQPQEELFGTYKSENDYLSIEVRNEEEVEALEKLLRSEVVLAESVPLPSDDSLSLQAQLRSPELFLQEPFLSNISITDFFYTQDESFPPFYTSQSTISLPPSAFLGPKCALWDCPRPARPPRGSEWYQDYCSDFHASLAVTEGTLGIFPVIRPGGIDLKDGPLYSAVAARSQGKAVGIPECEGAATSKSPWNAPEFFDISIFPGETIREWLFFDKPRMAFESGTRKQRSLPDYSGRGWHESRKQPMKDMGGLKRSYYMDPQPDPQFDWHLYEYELGDCNAWALYRLELKQLTTSKKISQVKGQNDQVTTLQHQIGKLSADLTLHDCTESRNNNKAEIRSTQTGCSLSPSSVANQVVPVADKHFDDSNMFFEYVFEDIGNYLSMPQ